MRHIKPLWDIRNCTSSIFFWPVLFHTFTNNTFLFLEHPYMKIIQTIVLFMYKIKHKKYDLLPQTALLIFTLTPEHIRNTSETLETNQILLFIKKGMLPIE